MKGEGEVGSKERVVVVSGYFDPLHVGHIEYFNLAKKLGDKLVVILNNDKQAALKKGKPFMTELKRKAVLEALGVVDEVFISIDEDGSVCESLRKINPDVFAEGGDRFSHNVPETGVCEDLGIEMVDGLGKKIESSSRLIKESSADYSDREWGRFISIEKGDGYQVKRLILNPGKRISLQRHFRRSEHWVVVSGVAKVRVGKDEMILRKDESVYIPVGVVHRLENIGKDFLNVIEVQNGEYLGEDDIERIEDDFGRVERGGMK